jgi:hypothetical protein
LSAAQIFELTHFAKASLIIFFGLRIRRPSISDIKKEKKVSPHYNKYGWNEELIVVNFLFQGLLALEGELTPILVQMVKSANTNGLLDNDNQCLSKYQNM